METFIGDILNPIKDRHMFSQEEINSIVLRLSRSNIFEPAYKMSSNGLVQNTLSHNPLAYFWEREEGQFDPHKSPPVRFSIKFEDCGYVVGIAYHYERELGAGKTISDTIKRAEINAIEILKAYKAVDKLK